MLKYKYKIKNQKGHSWCLTWYFLRFLQMYFLRPQQQNFRGNTTAKGVNTSLLANDLVKAIVGRNFSTKFEVNLYKII